MKGEFVYNEHPEVILLRRLLLHTEFSLSAITIIAVYTGNDCAE